MKRQIVSIIHLKVHACVCIHLQNSVSIAHMNISRFLMSINPVQVGLLFSLFRF